MARDFHTLSEQDRRAAYRRGKVLTAVMVGLTAVGVFIPALVRLFTDHATHDWSEFVFGPVLFGVLVWFALRGESISTGLLMAFYTLLLSGPFMLVGVLALLYFAPQLWTSSDGSPPQLDPPDWRHAPDVWGSLGLVAVAAQVMFSLWVLFFSRDARFYRDSRRRGIHSADDPALTAPVPPPIPAGHVPPPLPRPVRAFAIPPVSPEAFRRGKFLTLAVVLVTAALCLAPAVRDVYFGYSPDKLPTKAGQNLWFDLVCSGLIIGGVCWCAWRGGRNSTGCLTIFYSIGVAAFAFAAPLILAATLLGSKEGATYKGFGLTIKDIGHGLGGTFAFVGLSAWMAFSFWVLVRSPDARAYRKARQRGLRSVADSFNEWHLRRH